MFNLHVTTEVAFQVELAGAIRAFKGLVSCMKVHVTQQIIHSIERFSTNLALERLHRGVHYHMGLQRLLLYKGLKADMALEWANTGMDQHVALHVGMQSEFPPTYLTLKLLYSLVCKGMLFEMVDLAEFHATFFTDKWSHILMLQHVVLELTAIVEGLVALHTLVHCGSLVGGDVTFQLC